MSSFCFYDDDWWRLLRENPLIARKIEDLRCEVANYEEFEELRKRVDQLEKKVSPEITTKETCTCEHNSYREVKSRGKNI